MALAAFATLGIASCGGHTNVSPGEQCREQIVLSLAPGVDRTDRVVKSLSRNADVRLEYVRSVSMTLFVFELSQKTRDPGCKQALARLRQDSKVRFVELDRRRSHYDALR